MSESITFRLAFAALVLGGAAIAMFGGGATRRQLSRTACHSLVCLIGATGYWALMAGQQVAVIGSVEIATRSLAWFFAIPLLVLSVSVTAAPLGRSIMPTTLTTMFLAAVSALASAVAAETVGASIWIWFFVWLISLGLVFGMLWQPLADFAAGGHPLRNATYRRHAGVLTVLLSLFPLAFLMGPDMLGLWVRSTFDAVVAFLDVVLMAGYGLLVVFEDEKLVELEQAAEHAGTEGAALLDRPDDGLSGGRRLDPGYMEAGAATAVERARRRAQRARERIAAIARDPSGAGPAPTRRDALPARRPRRKRAPRGPFTWAELDAKDAVPVTLVALTLFVIANADRSKR